MVSAGGLSEDVFEHPALLLRFARGFALWCCCAPVCLMLLHTSQHFPGGSGAYTTFFLTLLLTGLLTGSAAVFIFVTTSRGPDRLVSRLGTLLGAATSALLLFVPHATGIV